MFLKSPDFIAMNIFFRVQISFFFLMINASKCNNICRSVPTLLLTENESVDNVQVLRKASVRSVDNTLRWFGMVQCVCLWCLSGGLRDSNASPTPENPSTGRSNLDVFNLFVICKEMCLLYQSTSLFILISQVIFFSRYSVIVSYKDWMMFTW